MKAPKVSKCANPACNAEFKRLGEGKLYAHPPHGPGSNVKRLVTAWLCADCASTLTMRFDYESQVFQLQHRARAA